MGKTCAFCDKMDGLCYTSNPPKRKCTITGKFHEYDHICDVPQTNADRIRAMSDEELAGFIRSMVDESNSHEVACYGCINYGTHHSDPNNKGTHLYECEGCPSEGIGLDIVKWLQQPVEVSDNA